MKNTWRLMIPLLGALGILGGCAQNLPAPDRSEAWVDIGEEPSATLMADTLDGKRLDDGRYFEVSAGKHVLGARLFVDGPADSNGETCSANVSYRSFQAGRHYSLVESSLGLDYEVTLYDDKNQALATTSRVDCMPG